MKHQCRQVAIPQHDNKLRRSEIFLTSGVNPSMEKPKSRFGGIFAKSKNHDKTKSQYIRYLHNYKQMKYIFLLLFATVFTSCEKVIDFPLKNTPPKPVIDARINSLQHTATVTFTQSEGYYDTTFFPAVTGAAVAVTDDAGNRFVLEEYAPGFYQSMNLPVAEKTYWHLSVSHNGETYEADSYMPAPVLLDSVYYVYSSESLFAPEGYRVWATFTDPPGEENYYRLKLFVNGKDVTNGIIYLWSDTGSDGAHVQFIFYRHALSKGDRFRVELWAIDEAAYDYLFALQNTISGNENASLAAPANPENNLSGDALGYFTATAVSTSEEVVIN